MYSKVYRLEKTFREILLISSDSGIVAVFVLESLYCIEISALSMTAIEVFVHSGVMAIPVLDFIEILEMSLTVIKVFMNSGVVAVSVLDSIEILEMSWTVTIVPVLCLNGVH